MSTKLYLAWEAAKESIGCPSLGGIEDHHILASRELTFEQVN